MRFDCSRRRPFYLGASGPLSCVLGVCLVVLLVPGLAWAEDGKVPQEPPKLRQVEPPTRRPPTRRVDLRPPVRRAVDLPKKVPPTAVRPVVRAAANTSQKPFWKQHAHGLVVRGAALFIPEFFLTGLFFDEAPGVTNGGFGLAYALKTDESFTFVFGVGYHFLNFIDGRTTAGDPIPHVFLNKGDQSYQREFVKNTLSYLAFDVRFLKSFRVHPRFHILVGGGIGLGVVFGSVVRTDTTIDGYSPTKESEYKQNYKNFRSDPSNPANALPNRICQTAGGGLDCKLHAGLSEEDGIVNHGNSGTPQGRKEDRVPPVIPIAEFILGMVFPIVIDRFDIRIQGGIGAPRLFWVGMSSHVYF